MCAPSIRGGCWGGNGLETSRFGKGSHRQRGEGTPGRKREMGEGVGDQTTRHTEKKHAVESVGLQEEKQLVKSEPRRRGNGKLSLMRGA